MSATRELPHSYIKIGKRYRKDLGDLSSLAESIRTVGLIQRIVVDKNHNLIVGHRRFEAWKIAKGNAAVPCIIVSDLDDATKRLIAERDENTCRKEMAASELFDLGKAIDRLERPIAAASQGTRTDLTTSSQGVEKVRSTEKVGAALGMSGRQWSKIKALGEAAEAGDPQAAELMAAVDAGEKTINVADLEWRGRLDAEVERRKAARRGERPAGLPGAVGDIRSIPKRQNATVTLRRFCEQLDGYSAELEKIDLTQVNAAEAESLAGSLSRIRTVLSKTINQLRSIA